MGQGARRNNTGPSKPSIKTARGIHFAKERKRGSSSLWGGDGNSTSKREKKRRVKERVGVQTAHGGKKKAL